MLVILPHFLLCANYLSSPHLNLISLFENRSYVVFFQLKKTIPTDFPSSSLLNNPLSPVSASYVFMGMGPFIYTHRPGSRQRQNLIKTMRRVSVNEHSVLSRTSLSTPFSHCPVLGNITKRRQRGTGKERRQKECK